MRRSLWIITVVLVASCGMPAPSPMPRPNPSIPPPSADEGLPLRIIAVDVGQGDATLIIAPTGEALLVDAGPPGAGRDAILPLLQQAGINELTAIVVTHYHEDHFGGVAEVLAGPDAVRGTADDLVPTGGIYDRGEPQGPPESPRFPLYAASAAGHRRPAHPGEHLRLGDCDLEVVAAGGMLADGTAIDLGDPPDENAASIALLIEYAGFRMLIAGDVTGGGGDPPYRTPDVETALGPLIGDIDVLRVAHHGSQTSTNDAFLDATLPETAIISVGDENDHGHPHRAVVERLLDVGATVYQTERGWSDHAAPVISGGNITIDVDQTGNDEIGMGLR